MQYLKEDGNIDVEGINKLSIEEYTKVVNSFTSEQREYYYSHLPINEGNQHTVGIKFHPYDEVIKLGLGVDADLFMNKMREKYLKNGKK